MPQSDVFSLGIMLYQITTGTTPFSGESIVELMKSIVDCRVDPMTALPDGRPVPEAIRQLCRTVLTPNPEDRPTASELAERVTAFLDGIEERKRAVARAQENLAAGKSAIGQYTAARIDLAAKMATIQDVEQTLRDAPVLADAIGDGKALDPYLDVWRNRHEVKKSEHEAEHLYTRAVQALEQALESQELPAAHELLADLYWEKYAEARRLSDHPTALYFKALVLEHDRGQYANRLADKGHLEFVISPPNATVSIERYIESGPLYLPETVEWSGEALPVGTYRARVTLDGHQSADIPFLVEGNQTKVVTVDLVEGTFPGFSFIQGGETELGGDAEAPNALERTRVEVSTFLMAENPVTVGEYVEFLDALAENDVETAQGHAPRSPSGTRYVDYSEVEGRFMIPSADTDGDAWDPLWPIMMVNQLDALAYCAWRSARDGRIYRLPTEEEWEYAARGVDRRAYPWGNGYDRLISCSSRGIKNDQTESGHRSGPARIDEFPYDVSPFGVRHLGGLAIEWTSTLNYAGNCVLRGGGLFSTEAWCRAAARTAHSPDYLAVQFGFRLVLDIPEK